MLILGLDIATSCGHGLIDRAVKPSAWRCGIWHSAGENGEDKAGVLALSMVPYLKEYRPVFASIEMPQRSVTRFDRKTEDMAGGKVEQTINPNALQLSALAGAAVGILEAFRIPWGLVAPATWRAAYYGKGIKPMQGNDWKDLAIQHAQMQQIELPPTKAAKRDAAEAVGVAVAWEKCTFIPARHQASFMALRTGQMRAA